jgi:hypothetical protein
LAILLSSFGHTNIATSGQDAPNSATVCLLVDITHTALALAGIDRRHYGLIIGLITERKDGRSRPRPPDQRIFSIQLSVPALNPDKGSAELGGFDRLAAREELDEPDALWEGLSSTYLHSILILNRQGSDVTYAYRIVARYCKSSSFPF